MHPSGSQTLLRAVWAGLVATALACPAVVADDNADTAEPAVTIVLGPNQATATPLRQGSSRTGGGNIRVSQPTPDTISVSMTGAAVAKGHPFKGSMARLTFDLSQCFEVVFHSPKVQGARLVMWGRVVGLLRSDCCCKASGAAEVSPPGHAAVNCGPTEILTLDLPARAVACGQNLSVYDREGPVWVPVLPGKYTLHQVFGITASHRKGLFSRPASAEFAPDPALEEDWLSDKEPFHGAAKEEFGFQVILKVIACDENDGKEEKSAENNAKEEKGAKNDGKKENSEEGDGQEAKPGAP